jgi:small subunit ribosomal protein S5
MPERRPNPRFANRKQPVNPFETRLLDVKRVIKVTKGGRRFKFSALVVIGDKQGRVGFAIGKSIEVPEAIKKAERLARKNLYRVDVVGEQATVSHDIIGHHGAAKVLLKPAVEGKGIVASDKVRAVVELAGIRNIYSKNLGSNNPLNVVTATVKGLTNMRTKEKIMSLIDKKEL